MDIALTSEIKISTLTLIVIFHARHAFRKIILGVKLASQIAYLRVKDCQSIFLITIVLKHALYYIILLLKTMLAKNAMIIKIA
jgi:hypothetical protein